MDAMFYLFGYGSLINLASAARTLGRDVDTAAVRDAWLAGYRRTWRVFDHVLTDVGQQPGRPMTMAFYNIEQDAGARCNGVLIPLTAADVARFDTRERQYERVDVTGLVTRYDGQPAGGRVVTYVGKAAARQWPAGTVVARSYERLVRRGMAARGNTFAAHFAATTTGHELPRFDGDYRFADGKQHAAAGRRPADD